MSIEPGQPILAAIRWAHEWQQLSWTAMNQAMGHYLQGCANVALARTPQQALAAVYEAQAVLLRQSMEAFAGRHEALPQAKHRTRTPPEIRPRSLERQVLVSENDHGELRTGS